MVSAFNMSMKMRYSYADVLDLPLRDRNALLRLLSTYVEREENEYNKNKGKSRR